MPDDRVTSSQPNVLLPGDIILSHGSGSLDRLNRLLQAIVRGSLRLSPFSHAAICTSPATVIDADIFAHVGSRPLDAWLGDVSYSDAVVFRRPATIRSKDITAAATDQKKDITHELHFRMMMERSGAGLEIARWASYFAGRQY